MLYAGTQGHADKVPVARVQEWEAGLVRFLKSERPTILSEIDKQKALDDNLFARLTAAISTFNHQFGVDGYVDVADHGPSATAAPPARFAIAARKYWARRKRASTACAAAPSP